MAAEEIDGVWLGFLGALSFLCTYKCCGWESTKKADICPFLVPLPCLWLVPEVSGCPVMKEEAPPVTIDGRRRKKRPQWKGGASILLDLNAIELVSNSQDR